MTILFLSHRIPSLSNNLNPRGVHSLINLDHHNSASKTFLERLNTSAPTMAAATLTSPPYPSHPPPPYSHHTTKFSTPLSLSGMMSPPESHTTDSRRPSDEAKDLPSQRQNLPSLQEALSRPANYVPPPPPANTFPGYQANTYAFSQPPTSAERPNTTEVTPYQTHVANHPHPQRNSPPQTNYAPNSFSNTRPIEPPDRNRHQSLPSLRTALPQTTPHQTGSARYESDPRSWDRRGPTDSYSYRFGEENYYPHSTASNEGPSTSFAPRSPQNSQRPHYSRPEVERIDVKNGQPDSTYPVFSKVLKRGLGNFQLEVALAEVCPFNRQVVRLPNHLQLKSATIQLSKTTSVNLDTVQRYQQSGSMLHGIPSASDQDIMLDCQRRIDSSLQAIKYFTAEQQHILEDQNARNQHSRAPEHGDDMWGSDDQTFQHEAKKRRGVRYSLLVDKMHH